MWIRKYLKVQTFFGLRYHEVMAIWVWFIFSLNSGTLYILLGFVGNGDLVPMVPACSKMLIYDAGVDTQTWVVQIVAAIAVHTRTSGAWVIASLACTRAKFNKVIFARIPPHPLSCLCSSFFFSSSYIIVSPLNYR